MDQNSTRGRAFTIDEARERLGGISRGKIYELVGSGALRTFQIGRRRLVSEEALGDFIRKAESCASEPSVAAAEAVAVASTPEKRRARRCRR